LFIIRLSEHMRQSIEEKMHTSSSSVPVSILVYT
jgi:hypothetical protein